MKKFLIILILFFVQVFFGQKTVLYEEKEQTIFIDYSKNSEFFKRRKEYQFSRKNEDSLVIEDLNNFKKQNSFKNIEIKNLPKKWVELFLFRGKYYTYYPCDFCGDVDNIEFENSMFFTYRCEYIELNKIEKSSQVKDNFSLEISNSENKGILNIYMIDLEKGVAVFETKIENENTYKLMLDVSKLDKFPMIVNDCKSKKREIFNQFETPNFKKILYRNSLNMNGLLEKNCKIRKIKFKKIAKPKVKLIKVQ